jgi:aryl-phospho-beta-D-glucosidase BglC (GH1 family)
LIIAQTTFNDIPGAGADIEIKLTTNGDVTATCNVSWITQSAALRSMSERTVNFKVSSNYGDPREGTITFSLGSLTETVTIKQLAGEISNIGMNSDAMTLAKKMYAGWNIGNTLEAIGGETAWGNPKISENYVKKIKELGFNAIRIPCSWDQYIENTTTYKIKDSWLDRVNEVVGYCVNNDMYVIVNIHWDGGWLENNCTPDKQVANNKKQQALWTQIANKLNHYDEHLLFAGTNEPNADDATKMAVLKTYLQTFVDAVRATGGNNAVRNLIVQGTNTNIGLTTTLFGNMPNDVVENRLMLEVHNYDPWTFCGMDKDESWGKMAYYWGAYEIPGSDRNSTYFEEDEMKATFNQMTTNFVNKGIPVILGECGAITFHTGIPNLEAHILSRKLYDKTMIREAKNHGLVPFYWETGGVIDRNTGAIKESYDYDGIMEGAAEGKYPF